MIKQQKLISSILCFLLQIFIFFIINLIYFIIILPTSLILRLMHLDILNLKFEKINSYWIKKK